MKSVEPKQKKLPVGFLMPLYVRFVEQCIVRLCTYDIGLGLFKFSHILLYPRNEVRGGGILESPCPSVRPSVDARG